MTRANDPRTHITTPDAPPPAGHYSQGLIHNGLVWIAGQTPRLPDGTRLDDEPFDVQARQALRNVESVAAAAGSSLARALQVTVFLTNPEDRFVFDDVWGEFMDEPYPTRAVVQSNLPGFAVEIVAVCALHPEHSAKHARSEKPDEGRRLGSRLGSLPQTTTHPKPV